jgi:hypothetical protein
MNIEQINKKLIRQEQKKINDNAQNIFKSQINRKIVKPIYFFVFFFI